MRDSYLIREAVGLRQLVRAVRRQTKRVSVVVVAALLVGCGGAAEENADSNAESSSMPDPDESTGMGPEEAEDQLGDDLEAMQANLGACLDLGAAHEEQRERMGIADSFRESLVWFRIPEGSDLDVTRSEYRYDMPDPPEMMSISLDEEHALGSFVSDHVLVPRWATDRIEEVADGELPDVYIGAVVHEDDGELSSGLLALADDWVAFVADCGNREMSEPLAAYADEHDRSGQDVLEDLIADQDAVAEFADWEESRMESDAVPRTWEEQSPAMRQLDPELAPDHILDEAVPVQLYFEVDTDLPDGTIVCLRSQFARSGCVNLSSTGSISYSVLAMPGHDLEFVQSVENSDGTVSDRTEVATLASDDVDRVGRSVSSDEPVGIRVQVEGPDQTSSSSLELTLSERPLGGTQES